MRQRCLQQKDGKGRPSVVNCMLSETTADRGLPAFRDIAL